MSSLRLVFSGTGLSVIGSLLLVALRAADARGIRTIEALEVKVDDTFWSPRIEAGVRATVPHALDECQATHRIANFARAAGLEEGGFRGTYFNDSDVYKVVEGAAYALAQGHDPALQKRIDELIAKIAGAQEKDGYLYTSRTLIGRGDYRPPGGEKRWSAPGGARALLRRAPLPGGGGALSGHRQAYASRRRPSKR